MVTLKDIANKTGLSIATVSKALNNMPDISNETITRVQKIAVEMGYLPNAAARSMKTGRSMTIGLLWFFPSNNIWEAEHFGKIAASIQKIMNMKGYDITPVDCNGANMMGSWLNYCRYRNYDGLVLLSGIAQNEMLDELIASDYPLVSIDLIYPKVSCVMTDGAEGMEVMVQHAFRKGHRKIAYIRGEDCLVTQMRFEGFRRRMKLCGLEIRDEYIKDAGFHDTPSALEAAKQLLRMTDPPTCIFFPDDFAAIGVMNELMAMGVQIPKDVSIVGFDGIRSSNMVRPHLTTYRQDCASIGRMAAELLLERIENRKASARRHITLPGFFIEGGTVADIHL